MGPILVEANNKIFGFLKMAFGMNCDFIPLLELEFWWRYKLPEWEM